MVRADIRQIAAARPLSLVRPITFPSVMSGIVFVQELEQQKYAAFITNSTSACALQTIANLLNLMEDREQNEDFNRWDIDHGA